jgi:hypothetical protein
MLPGPTEEAVVADLAARIGDPDVDFDVTTTLRSVVRCETDAMIELVLECEGGVGGWANETSSIHDVDHVTSVSIVAGFNIADESLRPTVRNMIERIVGWGTEGAVVRVLSAPGRLTTLYGPDEEVAYLPRTDPPARLGPVWSS